MSFSEDELRVRALEISAQSGHPEHGPGGAQVVVDRAEAYYAFLSGIERSTTPIAPAKPKAGRTRKN